MRGRAKRGLGMTDCPGPPPSPADALRFAFGTLTALPVRLTRWDRAAARGGMLCAPLAGLVVGLAAAALGGAVLLLGGGPLLAAVATAAVPYGRTGGPPGGPGRGGRGHRRGRGGAAVRRTGHRPERGGGRRGVRPVRRPAHRAGRTARARHRRTPAAALPTPFRRRDRR